jgi:hypothetical protein
VVVVPCEHGERGEREEVAAQPHSCREQRSRGVRARVAQPAQPVASYLTSERDNAVFRYDNGNSDG